MFGEKLKRTRDSEKDTERRDTKVGFRVGGEGILRQRCEIWPRWGLLSTGNGHIPAIHFKNAFQSSLGAQFSPHPYMSVSQPGGDPLRQTSPFGGFWYSTCYKGGDTKKWEKCFEITNKPWIYITVDPGCLNPRWLHLKVHVYSGFLCADKVMTDRFTAKTCYIRLCLDEGWEGFHFSCSPLYLAAGTFVPSWKLKDSLSFVWRSTVKHIRRNGGKKPQKCMKSFFFLQLHIINEAAEVLM